MKRKAITILLIFLVFLCGCNSDQDQTQTTTTQTANSTTVYITETGECYHLATCRCLSKSKIAKDLDYASKHYRPCQICSPPGID